MRVREAAHKVCVSPVGPSQRFTGVTGLWIVVTDYPLGSTPDLQNQEFIINLRCLKPLGLQPPAPTACAGPARRPASVLLPPCPSGPVPLMGPGSWVFIQFGV